MMRSSVKYGFLFVAVIVVLLLTIVRAKKEIGSQAGFALQESIIDDYYQRVGRVPSATSGKHRDKVKEISIDLGDEVVEYVFGDSVEMEIADRLVNQYVLARINSLNPDSFNHHFRKRLAQFSISGETGVAYRFHNRNFYSNNDSISASSARYQSPNVTLDLLNEASVSVWVNYNFMTVVTHASAFPFFGIGLLIVWGIISWWGFYFKRKEKLEVQEQELAVVEVVSEVKLSHELEAIPEVRTVSEAKTMSSIENESTLLAEKELISNGLYISSLRELYINREHVPIQPLPLRILELLIKEMEHGGYVSRECIKNACWEGKPTEVVNTRIDTHIKQIRKLLLDSGYEVVTVRKEGFLLQRI